MNWTPNHFYWTRKGGALVYHVWRKESHHLPCWGKASLIPLHWFCRIAHKLGRSRDCRCKLHYPAVFIILNLDQESTQVRWFAGHVLLPPSSHPIPCKDSFLSSALVFQRGHTLAILLSLPPSCWDERCVSQVNTCRNGSSLDFTFSLTTAVYGWAACSPASVALITCRATLMVPASTPKSFCPGQSPSMCHYKK